MLKIYEYKKGDDLPVLRRPALNRISYPASVLERTAQLFGAGVTPPQAVTMILQSVEQEGDQALYRWAALLDRQVPRELRISPEAMRQAAENLAPGLHSALENASWRIRRFHEFQLPGGKVQGLSWETRELGGRLGQRFTPIEKVGVYVPGGTAPLPSSLLMSVIPAQVAGVKEIVLCTPPPAHPMILAAAWLCGVEQVFQVGGAQAIAAMAFGTESIPRVDKIVGAGNLFVTLAKQQVYGLVGLDGLAGPTETVVVADASADPAWVAADLLAQAEHDVLATAILFTPDRKLAEAVQAEVGRQMEQLSRAEIIAQALESRSGIVITPDIETACALASEFAAEHTCLAVQDPQALAPLIPNAGGLFLGEYSFEVSGDYVAGPSHVMPTGGTARFASPLNVLDFVKITSVVALDPLTGKELSAQAAEIAQAERLDAHAAAATRRIPAKNQQGKAAGEGA